MKWIWWTALSIAAAQDWKYRWISLEVLGVCLIPGCLNLITCGSDIKSHMAAAIIGSSLLLLSKITRGAIGEGDGLFFLLTACYLDFEETAILFLSALAISCLWSSVLMLRGWRTGRNTLGDSVPFLTCAWFPGLWLLFR